MCLTATIFLGGTILLVLGTQQVFVRLGKATSGARGWTFHPEVVSQNLLYLMEGLRNTLTLSCAVIVLAFSLGVLVALARSSGNATLRFLASCYVDVLRNTPALVQLLIIYFAPPTIGIRLSVPVAAVLGLGLNNSAYMAEIIRAGIQSLSHGQTEAGLAVGMSYPQIMRWVVLPQAIRVVYPPLTNQLISIVLFSSLASVIAYPELAEYAKRLDSRTFRSFEIYGAVTIIYSVTILTLALVLRGVERRYFAVVR